MKSSISDFFIPWSLGVFLLLGHQTYALSAPDVFSVKRGHAVIKLANQSHREIDLFSTGNTDEIGYVVRDANCIETQGLLAGVTGNLTVRTKNGTSRVVIDGLTINGNLTIVALAEADRAELYNLSVGKNLRVVSGPGDDTVSLDNVVVHGNTILLGQNGHDTHNLFSTQINGKLTLVSGTGDDSIEISSGLAGGVTIGGKVLINTGSGVDHVSLTEVEIEDGVRVLTGSSDDLISVTSIDFLGSTLIDLGPGDDSLELSDSLFIAEVPAFLGSSGNDSFVDGMDNISLLGEPRIIGFETIYPTLLNGSQ